MADQQACYDEGGNLITSYKHGAGRFRSTHTYSRHYYISQFFNDLLPFLTCCKFQSPNSPYCDEYQLRRPTSSCKNYVPPRPGITKHI